jgi:hypothetical protein
VACVPASRAARWRTLPPKGTAVLRRPPARTRAHPVTAAPQAQLAAARCWHRPLLGRVSCMHVGAQQQQVPRVAHGFSNDKHAQLSAVAPGRQARALCPQVLGSQLLLRDEGGEDALSIPARSAARR